MNKSADDFPIVSIYLLNTYSLAILQKIEKWET